MEVNANYISMVPSTIIFGCGCTTQVVVPDNLDRADFTLENPRGEGKFDIELVRMSKMPSVFVEVAWSTRPEWAKTCHAMEWFDIRTVAQANWQPFEPLFAAFRQQFGPLIPRCWLPDILRGSGRFHGLWHHQKVIPGRSVAHLKVLDLPEPELAPERLTFSTSAPEGGPPIAT